MNLKTDSEGTLRTFWGSWRERKAGELKTLTASEEDKLLSYRSRNRADPAMDHGQSQGKGVVNAQRVGIGRSKRFFSGG